MGAHIFTKIKNADGCKKNKNVFFNCFIWGTPNFPAWAFSENAQCFVGVFLLIKHAGVKTSWPTINIKILWKACQNLLRLVKVFKSV